MYMYVLLSKTSSFELYHIALHFHTAFVNGVSFSLFICLLVYLAMIHLIGCSE